MSGSSTVDPVQWIEGWGACEVGVCVLVCVCVCVERERERERERESRAKARCEVCEVCVCVFVWREGCTKGSWKMPLALRHHSRLNTIRGSTCVNAASILTKHPPARSVVDESRCFSL